MGDRGLERVAQRVDAAPEEIAAAVLYIGSGQAAYLTGQTITLDGGLMAGWPLFPAA
jgi:NAD(P)-dependent dehydrogenase (short-subunit alcohol dehydrogenase family)